MSMGIILGQRPRSIATPPQPALRTVPRRLPNEFYPTPPEATRALLSVETFDGSIWEPACGEGAIASVLKDAGHTVVATDLVDYGFGIPRVDFLKELRPRAKHIVIIRRMVTAWPMPSSNGHSASRRRPAAPSRCC